MTSEQREFHQRMNDEITDALVGLAAGFDIHGKDREPDTADWHVLRSDLKDLLLRAYARNHPWINS